jgi:hypothetical protein
MYLRSVMVHRSWLLRGLVDKRKIACYEHVKFEVESCGGVWVADEEAVQDGRDRYR